MADKSSLQLALEACDYSTSSYSGRGMYGKTCLATVTSDPPWRVTARTVAAYVDLFHGPDGSTEGVTEFAEEVSEARTDSMGMELVVYWPEIEYVGEESK